MMVFSSPSDFDFFWGPFNGFFLQLFIISYVHNVFTLFPLPPSNLSYVCTILLKFFNILSIIIIAKQIEQLCLNIYSYINTHRHRQTERRTHTHIHTQNGYLQQKKFFAVCNCTFVLEQNCLGECIMFFPASDSQVLTSQHAIEQHCLRLASSTTYRLGNASIVDIFIIKTS